MQTVFELDHQGPTREGWSSFGLFGGVDPGIYILPLGGEGDEEELRRYLEELQEQLDELARRGSPGERGDPIEESAGAE